ncbi:hypothetical protein [Sphingosinicella sp. BN140058]|uniref:hypothetical protein n=1 Tax=Sphingosinicella sp. BN140058 TaxID=1892855 RepID=UPI001010C172|nr:hypothetical protein [Sphingosinicella sp. BN140058]QAY80182.1 hypothetical protein ETR14_26425 [Sphingosinicella sp. BN140058]
MSLARYANRIDVIAAIAETGRRGVLITQTPAPEVLDRVAVLLRSGARQGIVPEWKLRKSPSVVFEQHELDGIAKQVEDGFCSGAAPYEDGPAKAWRIDFYVDQVLGGPEAVTLPAETNDND